MTTRFSSIRPAPTLAMLLVGALLCGTARAQPPRQRARHHRGAVTSAATRVSGRPTDGLAFCRKAVTRIKLRVRRGKRVAVVFDIDNTLVDTRYRTLAAARSFAKKRSSLRALAGASLGQMAFSGQQTAHKLGLPSGDREAFSRYWDRFFWDARNLSHDRPIAHTVELARRAKAAGAEVFYITGRVDTLKMGTVDQLKALGLPDADSGHVICKPMVSAAPGKAPRYLPTAPFKVDQVKGLLSTKHEVAWFASDSVDDIRAVQTSLSGVPAVWIDFPAKSSRPGPIIAADTPTIKVK